jgi:hypothetical protein
VPNESIVILIRSQAYRHSCPCVKSVYSLFSEQSIIQIGRAPSRFAIPLHIIHSQERNAMQMRCARMLTSPPVQSFVAKQQETQVRKLSLTHSLKRHLNLLLPPKFLLVLSPRITSTPRRDCTNAQTGSSSRPGPKRHSAVGRSRSSGSFQRRPFCDIVRRRPRFVVVVRKLLVRRVLKRHRHVRISSGRRVRRLA